MTVKENLRYIELLDKCPYLYREELEKIEDLRNRFSNQFFSEEVRQTYYDILDSVTIFLRMLLPFQYLIGMVTRYRGVALLNFNRIFDCEPISSLDLFEFLRTQNETDRKIILKHLTVDDKQRGFLYIAVENNKPKQFIKLLSESPINHNVLKGLFALHHTIQQTPDTDEFENLSCDVGTMVKYVFAYYGQLALDLANVQVPQDDAVLIDTVIQVIESVDFESETFAQNIESLSKIKNRIRPLTFTKICRYLLYYTFLGFYIAFDKDRLNVNEKETIYQIFYRNQFRNYGNIVLRKCHFILSLQDKYERENRAFNNLHNTRPKVWKVLHETTPFIEDSIERDKSASVQSEIFNFSLKSPDLKKLQSCINALALWGYIDNNPTVKHQLYYRLTGYARPKVLSKIEWHNDIKVLFLVLKVILERGEKYKLIKDFFNVTGYDEKMIGKESSYADRTKDKNIRNLLEYLYGNSK